MATDDHDTGRVFHVRLNSYDRAVLEFLKAHYGTSFVKAIRVSLRAAARQVGFKDDRFPDDFGENGSDTT